MNILKIEKIIIQTLKDLIETLSVNKIDKPNKLNKGTVLFGYMGILDSMGLVSLITDLEEKLEQELNISLVLADERAMSQERSPFRTVSSLSEYIFKLIKEQRQDGKS